jgi:hypothetical protein
MKKSVIFFAVFLLVLLVAVLSERREKDDQSVRFAMGEETSTQLVTPEQIPE